MRQLTTLEMDMVAGGKMGDASLGGPGRGDPTGAAGNFGGGGSGGGGGGFGGGLGGWFGGNYSSLMNEADVTDRYGRPVPSIPLGSRNPVGQMQRDLKQQLKDAGLVKSSNLGSGGWGGFGSGMRAFG